MRKRILAILMAFALFVVMGPVDMFAFATDEEAAEDTKVEMQSEEAVEEAVEEVAAETEEKPLDKMLKAELVEYAEKNGIETDAKATKAEILEAINAAK